MPSFGEKLKLERVKRKITLEQISATTKISTRMLQALEEEKFNQLPGGIFNKGFVRAYARMLGLDEEQALADYLEASGEAAPVRADAGGRETSREGGGRPAPIRITDDNTGRLEIRAEMASRQLPWGVFAVVLLIVALALSLWSHRRREQERRAHPSSPIQNSETHSPDTNRSSNVPASAPSPASTADAPPAPATANSPPTMPTENNSTALSTPSSTPQAGSANLNPAPGEFVVAVHARDESWVSVVVDGQPVGSETLAAGDQRVYHGRRLVIAKVGNAAALDFQLNGKALSVGGDAGQVKKVTIGPVGVVAEPETTTP